MFWRHYQARDELCMLRKELQEEIRNLEHELRDECDRVQRRDAQMEGLETEVRRLKDDKYELQSACDKLRRENALLSKNVVRLKNKLKPSKECRGTALTKEPPNVVTCAQCPGLQNTVVQLRNNIGCNTIITNIAIPCKGATLSSMSSTCLRSTVKTLLLLP